MCVCLCDREKYLQNAGGAGGGGGGTFNDSCCPVCLVFISVLAYKQQTVNHGACSKPRRLGSQK